MTKPDSRRVSSASTGLTLPKEKDIFITEHNHMLDNDTPQLKTTQDFVEKDSTPVETMYEYFQEDGSPAYQVKRTGFKDEKGNSRKNFSISHWDGNKNAYRSGGGHGSIQRPLYRLPEVMGYADKPILVCEGEKAAEAAQRLFPRYACTTSMGGAQSPHKTDWGPVKGRAVIISPDLDDAGKTYESTVRDLCAKVGAQAINRLDMEKLSALIIGAQGEKKSREGDIPKGYDLADAEEEGWTAELIEKHFPEGELIAPFKESLEETVHRLASLSPLAYDQVRKEEAKRLNVQLPTLDGEIKKCRKETLETADDTELFPAVDEWTDPVDIPDLLDELVTTLQRFAILPQHADVAIALWITFTWCVDSVNVAPILAICSPEKQCGKTTVLSLLLELVQNPLQASNITAPALFRSIEKWHPTLIIDEADTFINDNEELRGVMNSGHTRKTAFVIRTVGESHEPKQFNTWGAKAIALIGKLPDTLHDRSLVINLRRKLSHESTEKLRYARGDLFEILRRKLKRFSNDHGEQLKNVQPQLPAGISDRAQDNWEPLLAIAEFAGGEWPSRALAAALALSSFDQDAASLGNELLRDIQEIFVLPPENIKQIIKDANWGSEDIKSSCAFDNGALSKISSAFLITLLCLDEEKSWATYNRGKRFSPRQLSKKLSEYGIKSKSVRISDKTSKGFDASQFKEAFDRYLASPQPIPILSGTPAQSTKTPSILRPPAVPDHSQRSGADIMRNGTTPERAGTEKLRALHGCAGVPANSEGTQEESQWGRAEV